MNYLYNLAQRNKQTPTDFIRAFIGLLVLALFASAIIIASTIHIRDLLKMPILVTGRLTKVEYSYQQSLELYVGGDVYVLRKQSKYSDRSFGLRNNMTLREIREILEQNIERKDIVLEYVQESGKNLIVRLSIAGSDYVDKEIAVGDFVGLERTTRWIGISLLFITTILLFLIYKGLLH